MPTLWFLQFLLFFAPDSDGAWSASLVVASIVAYACSVSRATRSHVNARTRSTPRRLSVVRREVSLRALLKTVARCVGSRGSNARAAFPTASDTAKVVDARTGVPHAIASKG